MERRAKKRRLGDSLLIAVSTSRQKIDDRRRTDRTLVQFSVDFETFITLDVIKFSRPYAEFREN